MNMNKYEWAVSQAFSVDSFKCVENTSQFTKAFLQNANEDSDERYFIEADVKYPEKIYDLHNNLPFWLNEKNWKSWKTCTQLLL